MEVEGERVANISVNESQVWCSLAEFLIHPTMSSSYIVISCICSSGVDLQVSDDSCCDYDKRTPL